MSDFISYQRYYIHAKGWISNVSQAGEGWTGPVTEAELDDVGSLLKAEAAARIASASHESDAAGRDTLVGLTAAILATWATVGALAYFIWG